MKNYDSIPKHDMTIRLVDFNVQVGQETYYREVVGINTIHEETNNMDATWNN